MKHHPTLTTAATSQPSLTHDKIKHMLKGLPEEWQALLSILAKESARTTKLEEQVGKLWAYCDQLQPRVAELEAPDGATWKQLHTLGERVGRLEEVLAEIEYQAQNPPEPRGPHD